MQFLSLSSHSIFDDKKPHFLIRVNKTNEEINQQQTKGIILKITKSFLNR